MPVYPGAIQNEFCPTKRADPLWFLNFSLRNERSQLADGMGCCPDWLAALSQCMVFIRLQFSWRR
jgi:hypothetical protein